jgi:Ca-activated chloride channel family protein
MDECPQMGLSDARNLHFLHPAWLAALPLLFAFAAWQWRRQRREGGWSRVIDADLLSLLRLPAGRGESPWWIVILSWTLAVLALAGVTWQREQSAGYRAPSDWILVMDLSPSMAAADVPPDRATRARYVISDFLNAAEDTRVALVVFAGEAHTVAPLTTDVATVRALLPALSPNIMPESGDDLAPALDEVSRLMENAGSARPQIVILSDGISDPAHALAAAQGLRAHGATIDVIGIGTEHGAPVPKREGGFELDANGNSVMSKLDADQLRRIAAAGGGDYVPESQARRLIGQLQQRRSYQARSSASDQAEQVSQWRNDGIWLLPLLLLCVPLLARRGWL